MIENASRETLLESRHSLAILSEDATCSLADVAMCKRVFDLLEQHYPGHPWAVWSDVDQNIVVVRILYQTTLRGTRMGYVVHLDKLDHDPGMKEIVRAGGELLERWGLPRGGATQYSRFDAAKHGLDLTSA